MISKQLIHPESVAVVGASPNLKKIGGITLRNLIDTFQGSMYAVNRNGYENVQGVPSFRDVKDLPSVDCAILTIPAEFCADAVEELVNKKGCKGIILLSGGFRESGTEGAAIENRIKEICDKSQVSLLGPNCTGLITPSYAGTFSQPIPVLNPFGATLVSASGSTVVYILETAMHLGLTFNSVYSIGNSTQNGVEDILEYIDNTYEPGKSSQVIMLYIESISHPERLQKHASSLIAKGAKICAIKAGTSEKGRTAASLHTGVIASPDKAVDALFEKIGIVRCYSRTELVFIAAAMMLPQLKGKRIAVISQAGGPAILQTDFFANSGIEIPHIDTDSDASKKLLAQLNPGASISNPIDLLTTGSPEQLGNVLDFCENHCPQIDAMSVIWGSPVVGDIDEVCDVLMEKSKSCTKPIYVVLTSSVITSKKIVALHQKGAISFPDEVFLAKALVKISQSRPYETENIQLPPVDRSRIREVMGNNSTGYLQPEQVSILLDAAGITRVKEASAYSIGEALEAVREMGGYPLAMKAIGPRHKKEVSGLALNIKEDLMMKNEFERMMNIPEVEGVLFQKMLSGTEIFIGAKKEEYFGHLIMCGMGGVFVEVLDDISTGLSPISKEEADNMIQKLKAFKILQGYGHREGVNLRILNETIRRVSALCMAAPEIVEMDINPLLGDSTSLTAVNARIYIQK